MRVALLTLLSCCMAAWAADGPLDTAERLLAAAERGTLTGAQAETAASLLEHSDPFARGVAEWAIATRVQRDNAGQHLRCPREDPPPWYIAWHRLAPGFLLQADYVRQAVGWKLHRNPATARGSMAKILRRARGAASQTPPHRQDVVAAGLARLQAIQAKMAALPPDDAAGHRALWLEARKAARPIVLANRAVDFDRVAFIARHSAHSHRNITGSQYPWVHKPGGDILIQTGLAPDSPCRPVLDGRLGPGHVHGMDLRWDADRFCFAWARQDTWPPKHDTEKGDRVFLLRGEQEPTHIYTVAADGTDFRQVTRDLYWSDFEPTWCASGDIAFASDRSGRSSECGKFTADHTVINLYACAPDGSRLRRLSDNKDIDRYPHALDNGLIAYTRWDYQERHFLEVHAIWTVRPDGTQPDAVFNQHIRAPYGFRDTRSVPGSPRLVSIATGHHTFAYGPVVVLDPRKGINSADAISIVTPYVKPQEGPMAGRAVPEGGVPDAGGLYQTPWALSENCFLASYSPARNLGPSSGGRNAVGFAIYFIDVWGNKELVHRDPLLSCAFPMPVRRRPRPPIVADVREIERPYATTYVSDVQDGLAGVPRGAITHIRVLQRVGWPLDDKVGAMRWIPGNAWERKFGFWTWAPVRVIGTVPVEADGSAHFRVPADMAVYFQALDARGMEVRRMRSHVTLQAGEVRGCRGCHESQERTPAPAGAPVAVLHPAHTPKPPPWGARKLLGYEWLVQPVLDRHCVRCHDAKDAKGLDLTATPTPSGFVQSFRTLFGHRPGATKPGKPLVSVSNRLSGAAVSGVKEFGSHRSPFITVLLDDPLHRKEVKLSPAEWEALVTWVDANAPYYDTFYNRRPAGGGDPVRGIRVELPDPFAFAPTYPSSSRRQPTHTPDGG